MKIKYLIFIPFAGGNKYSYNSFKSWVPKGINLVFLDLPGRGDRISEHLLTDLNLLVEDLIDQLAKYIHTPYILFGHSMGGLLAYLMLKKIVHCRLQLPEYLFVTGCKGPSTININQRIYSNLSTTEFIEKIKQKGGMPNELLEDKSFIEFFEPIIRADMRAYESYKYLEDTKLNIPICVMRGYEEEITFQEALSWKVESSLEVQVMQFPGNHFFIFQHQKEIMKIIQNKLSK